MKMKNFIKKREFLIYSPRYFIEQIVGCPFHTLFVLPCHLFFELALLMTLLFDITKGGPCTLIGRWNSVIDRQFPCNMFSILVVKKRHRVCVRA